MKPDSLALLGSAIYATARYNIFKGVPWSDWPTYTLNKAFALAALLLLVVGVIDRSITRATSRLETLFMASAFASIHIILSVILLSPAYYEKFFEQGKLTAEAGLSMAMGAVASVVMLSGKRLLIGRDASDGLRRLSVLAFLAGLHAALQGFAGWFTPSVWPGMMPPITLLSFLVGVAAVGSAFRPRRDVPK